MFCTNLKINSNYFPICINQLGFVMEVQCTVNDLGTAFLQATYKKFMLHTGIRNIYQDTIRTIMSIKQTSIAKVKIIRFINDEQLKN